MPTKPTQDPNKPKTLLDPTFRYTNSNETDIRKTFARVRREMAAVPTLTSVVPIRVKK